MSWNKAKEVLNQGGVVVFPTDTVWGIGARLDNSHGVKRFYEIKKRERSKPSQLLIASLEMAQTYGNFNEKALDLAQKYWPGALTLIVPATPHLPLSLSHTDGTVGLRWPSFPLLETLITDLGTGLIASSANVSGGTAPLKFNQLDQAWLKQVEYVVSGEEAKGEPSSTIIKVVGEDIEIIRQGSVRI